MNNTNDSVSYTDIAIDLETFDTSPTAAMSIISAVAFNRATGEHQSLEDSFYEFVDVNSCIRAGLTVNGHTIMWWLGQSDEARNMLIDGQPMAIELAVMLEKLSSWYGQQCMQHNSVLNVWSNGANFDLPILRHAYAACDSVTPWKFYHEKCFRTLADEASHIRKNTEFNGLKHHPYWDNVHQIKVQHAVRTELGLIKQS